MKMYIYITGFGDHLNIFRQLLLLTWRVRGKKCILVPMHWNDKSELFEDKQKRIEKIMQSRLEASIILVGESAGGAMAISMLPDYGSKVSEVITICGFNHTAGAVHDIHKKTHPAFIPLVSRNDSNMTSIANNASTKITNIYSLKDGVIEPRYSRVTGSRYIELNTKGHQRSIIRIVLHFFNIIG